MILILILILTLTVAFLAYANRANDDFKGVASRYGCNTCGYRTAIIWAPDHLVLPPAFDLVAF